MRKLDLQLFVGGHSVTIQKDGGVSAASASSSSDVQKDAEVTLTVTFASGYELDRYEVLAGGVTVDPATKKFVMGESDVVIVVKSKKDNLYMVTEECSICLNDQKTVFHKNVQVVLTKQGGIVKTEGTPAEITLNDCVQQLIDQGILVKV